MSDFKKFPVALHEILDYYVYAYIKIDKNSYGEPMYVGKGYGNRCFDHLKVGVDEKSKVIQKLAKLGLLRIDILAYGLDEATALKVEAVAIDLIGKDNLLNLRRGDDSLEYGRITTDDLIAKLAPVEITDEADFEEEGLLIRINTTYFSGMPELDLYEATRGFWKANIDRCKNVKFVMSIYKGIIREVYECTAWLEAPSTHYSTRTIDREDNWYKGRIEFVGMIANEKIRNKYIRKDVSGLFPWGSANPLKYVGPGANT